MNQRTCDTCGTSFIMKRRDQRFCSQPCSRTAFRDSATKVCSVEDCGRPYRAKGFCIKHYKAQHPNRKTWKKNGDPEVRRASLRRRTQWRRAVLMDPDAEVVDRDAIGDRDGWRCGLCCKAIDRTLAYPDPNSASLDHVVPLSLGGKHVGANAQIAHLHCNVAKGNRVSDVQLLLVD